MSESEQNSSETTALLQALTYNPQQGPRFHALAPEASDVGQLPAPDAAAAAGTEALMEQRIRLRDQKILRKSWTVACRIMPHQPNARPLRFVILHFFDFIFAYSVKQMRKALSTMQVLDETGRIKELCLHLNESLSSMETFQVEAVLDELQYLCEEIDRASILHSFKGLAPALHLLSSPIASIRQRAAYLVGTCAQNNPRVQQQVKTFTLFLDFFLAVVSCILL